MDDAGVPSLLGLPYVGYVARDDPTYLRTRQYALSTANPYYFEGTAAKGTGGPHVGRSIHPAHTTTSSFCLFFVFLLLCAER